MGNAPFRFLGIEEFRKLTREEQIAYLCDALEVRALGSLRSEDSINDDRGEDRRPG